jgi:hypothetical protein
VNAVDVDAQNRFDMRKQRLDKENVVHARRAVAARLAAIVVHALVTSGKAGMVAWVVRSRVGVLARLAEWPGRLRSSHSVPATSARLLYEGVSVAIRVHHNESLLLSDLIYTAAIPLLSRGHGETVEVKHYRRGIRRVITLWDVHLEAPFCVADDRI